MPLRGPALVEPYLTEPLNRDLDLDLHFRPYLLPEPFFTALRILLEPPAIELSSIKATRLEIVGSRGGYVAAGWTRLEWTSVTRPRDLRIADTPGRRTAAAIGACD